MTLQVWGLRQAAGGRISCTQLLSSTQSRAAAPLPRCAVHDGRRRAGGRQQLVVRANELNKWANRDARDDDGGLPEDGFEKDTAAVVLRMLTARAVQRVLVQLQECDIFVAQWLNNFAADNKPSAEREQFLLALFAQQGKVVEDPMTGTTHNIDPQSLAHRILQVRADMAKGLASGFDGYTSLQNVEVMRAHLTNTAYTSGSTEKGYKERRGYRRPAPERRTQSPGKPRPGAR